ncbi:7439_t:CDS:1, partial [Racocetra persica]
NKQMFSEAKAFSKFKTQTFQCNILVSASAYTKLMLHTARYEVDAFSQYVFANPF